MTPEHKRSWICQTCRSKMPKKDNTDTPIRHRDNDINNQSPTDRTNVTIRKKQNCILNDSSISGNTSIFGDTMHNDSCLNDHTPVASSRENAANKQPSQKTVNPQSLPTLHQISELLDKKLDSMEKSILGKIAVSLEISLEVIKQESKSQQSQINELTTEQRKLQTEIDKIKENFKILEDKNKRLQTELEYMKKQKESTQNINTNDINSKQDSFHPTSPENNLQDGCNNNNNKIVIYGLDETQHEDEDLLINRIAYAIHEITGIDITGYVEDVARIGRKGNRRPVVMEFISKRIAKNILQSTYYFRRSGLHVTKYLNEEGRARRKILQEHLYDARNKGHHAIIRDNKLIINGKIIQLQSTQPIQGDNLEETKQNNMSFQNRRRQESRNSFRN